MSLPARNIAGWFLGPKAENADWERGLLLHILDDYYHWRRNYFPADDRLIPESLQREGVDFRDRLAQQLEEMLAGLRADFPFYSPRYNAHMISDQSIPAVLGYFAGLLYNPNNVTPESSPVTLDWEMEVGADILRMLGYRAPAPGVKSKEEAGWAHITSGGTVANLEALWIARNVRYFPLAVRDICLHHRIPFALRVGGELRPIESISEAACLGINPNQAIHLHSRFIDAVQKRWELERPESVRTARQLLRESRYSIPHAGTLAAYGVRLPKLVVSGARHYSVTKAADLLGIGRENIVLVDVDSRFRLDLRALSARLEGVIAAGELPLAVIGVAGTTEEGAVDPIDGIAAMRKELESSREESFWLHVDAAWGGYLRSLFSEGSDSVRGFVSRDLVLRRGRYEKHLRIEWGAPEVHAAFEALPLAESVTVDPHKLGYIPYPCGIAAYRNDPVRRFLNVDIPYLLPSQFEDTVPESVGPYILEGSKPGAAAAACWLSHRMIPPDRSGYGEIMRATLLGARELYERLVHWDTAARVNGDALPYRFLTIAPQPPDTNIVCFLVQDRADTSLERTNELNRRVYEGFTLSGRRGSRLYSYSQAFFISRTIFDCRSYPVHAISGLLERAGLDAGEYQRHGLFILRATVMSPYHSLAFETGARSLLTEFVERLHERVLEVIAAVHAG
jgi:glutamate/tyrosine decarboxylase-like PLP-dependent enzyme